MSLKRLRHNALYTIYFSKIIQFTFKHKMCYFTGTLKKKSLSLIVYHKTLHLQIPYTIMMIISDAKFYYWLLILININNFLIPNMFFKNYYSASTGSDNTFCKKTLILFSFKFDL